LLFSIVIADLIVLFSIRKFMQDQHTVSKDKNSNHKIDRVAVSYHSASFTLKLILN
jgi:hypothetical protein